ncbi:MAG: hypothetical protein HY709_01950 [Candidatus Latescibacteria bacterium]|nr:hypothetical protein [Candidatus Latescibacterota bacterium]
MQLTKDQSDHLADKMADFANLAITSLTFVTLLSGKRDWLIVAVGFILFVGSHVGAFFLKKGE